MSNDTSFNQPGCPVGTTNPGGRTDAPFSIERSLDEIANLGNKAGRIDAASYMVDRVRALFGQPSDAFVSDAARKDFMFRVLDIAFEAGKEGHAG